MAIQARTYKMGPENGTLAVRTSRVGAVAAVGHDLLFHVTSWEATVEIGEDPSDMSIELTVDSSSLRVREGTGGLQPLETDDKANIEQTIDDEILKRQEITFRSTEVRPAARGRTLSVRGDLTLRRRTHPVTFDLALAETGELETLFVIKQTDWRIKPYSALFGALKVADEVTIHMRGRLPTG